MLNIIKMITDKYLIEQQQIKLLQNGKILFIESNGEKEIQTKENFINDYIDFLTDLLEFCREEKDYTSCKNLLTDLNILFEGLEILKYINI